MPWNITPFYQNKAHVRMDIVKNYNIYFVIYEVNDSGADDDEQNTRNKTFLLSLIV